MDGSNNNIRVYETGGSQILGIGEVAGKAIEIITTATTNNGISINGDAGGYGLRFASTTNVGARGVYVNQSSTGASNIYPSGEFHHNGGYYALFAEGTNTSGGLIISQPSGSGKGIYITNSGSGLGLDIVQSGNGGALEISNSGSGKSINISTHSTDSNPAINISNSGTQESLYIVNSNTATGNAAVYVSKTGQGLNMKLQASSNSTGDNTGIVFDIANAGTGLEYAFSFDGSEKINAAVGGTQDRKIRIKVGGTTYYIPCYTA
jgi:hypothetical protein